MVPGNPGTTVDVKELPVEKTPDERRLARWDALGPVSRGMMLAEWDRANPARPGEDQGLRAETRLASCVDTLDRRARGGWIP